MSTSADGRPNSTEANPTPVDGGTLLPPPENAVLQGLSSTDSSLIADTSHVQQLISHGADVNAPDNNGWTPLHTAAYHGQEEIVRILLAANANVNARNKSEETPLHLAAKWPQDRVVEALLSGGADLTARNKRGRTPAHVAALFNRHAILDRLLNAGAAVNALDAEQQTPLHLAVRANCPVESELVKTLIRHDANLEHVDSRGHMPLHFLPSAQDWLHWAAYEGREKLLQVLLAKPGVRPDCYSEEGLTPLHLAAHVGNTNMVTMLLNAGAKVNAPSQPPTKSSGKDANTYGIPLPGAPGSITAGISISSQLKAYGSSKLPPGELTVLHIAAERGSAELIRVLVAAGAKVNIQGDRGMPPLHVAVWEGNTTAVVSLLAAKASVSLKSKAGGFTSVHCACLSSRATPELLALLLDNGGAAVIEERCQEGWTALHLACQSAPPAMVELLLARGARPTAKGKNGRTAADCASKRPEILQLLHVYTGGKVPLPLGMGLPSVAAAAAAANGLLTATGGGSGAAATANGGGGTAAGRGGNRVAGRGPAAATGSTSSSCSQAGLLPGTAAMLEPLESVEAKLAALLADMGGALCSLQAGAVFGGGACSVDPVGHCIRPLDKRLVMMCTLGCQFSFHLQCWKCAREVLKERWSNFTGSLAVEGRYSCFAPGCPGYIREQAICDGAQMQSSSHSRLYLMPQDVYYSLPDKAKPIGGGVPPPLGGSDGYGGLGAGQQHSTPLQPALPAGSGGGSGGLSLAALGPSLSLAQAMVQAAQAVGNIVGGSGRLGASQLAAALAATGGLPALLAANPPPVPQAMSAREAAAIAAETLGVGFGGRGSSSCVVEELGCGEDFDDDLDDMTASAACASTGRGSGGASTSARSSSGSGSSSTAAANGGSSGSSAYRKQGGAGGAGGGIGVTTSRRGAKGGGGKSLSGGKSTAPPPISSAAAAEMLQQLQGLQQAVAAVQNAVGAGSHSHLVGLNTGGSGGGGATAATASAGADGAAAAAVSAASAASSMTSSSRGPAEQQPTVLEPPREVLLPPRELPPAGPLNASGGDDGADDVGGAGSDVAPVPPPRRRTQAMPPMPRRAPQPLTGVPYENGRQPLSPQLATPPPATSLLTPGVQQLLSPPAATPGSAAAAAALLPLRQPDASLAPILVGPLSQQPPPAGPAAVTLTPAAAAPAEPLVPRAAAAPKPLSSACTSTGGSSDESHAIANGCGAVAAASAAAAVGVAGTAGSETRSGSSGGSSCSNGTCGGKPTSPRRAPGCAASGGAIGGRSGTDAASKPEPTQPPMANGPLAYGARVNLSAASLSINLIRGNPLATVAAAAAAAAGSSTSCGGGASGQSPPGLTVTRASGGRGALSATAQGAGPLRQHAGSYEPGDYARAVCPGLRPGVHRVTLSAGRSAPAPALPGDAATEAAAEAEAEVCRAPGLDAAEGGVDDKASAVASGAVRSDADAHLEAGSRALVLPAWEVQAGAGALATTENGPVARRAAVAAELDGLEAAAGSSMLTAEAAVAAAPGAAGATTASSNIILAALHNLRAGANHGLSSRGPGDGDGNRAVAVPEASRHLLLESADIPLLAATPGMLEAWLSAHVGAHGRLAAFRILAPQAAVAVSLESAAAADVASGYLRGRSNLLVTPLTVAPLAEFPDDDVLAASAQQVARASCPPGDRSWMRRMVELWEQLHALPPVLRDA